jgi:hypothetical protein
MEDIQKPFSVGYVLRTTVKHMRRSVEISIRKTVERIAEFDGDSDKSAEVLKTLSALHQMRAQLDAFQEAHSEHFLGE